MSIQVSGERSSAATAPSQGPKNSYYFSMTQPSQSVKQLTTYCGLGYIIAQGEDDTGSKSWTDLMNEAIPLIQADIDTWGLP